MKPLKVILISLLTAQFSYAGEILYSVINTDSNQTAKKCLRQIENSPIPLPKQNMWSVEDCSNQSLQSFKKVKYVGKNTANYEACEVVVFKNTATNKIARIDFATPFKNTVKDYKGGLIIDSLIRSATDIVESGPTSILIPLNTNVKLDWVTDFEGPAYKSLEILSTSTDQNAQIKIKTGRTLNLRNGTVSTFDIAANLDLKRAELKLDGYHYSSDIEPMFTGGAPAVSKVNSTVSCSNLQAISTEIEVEGATTMNENYGDERIIDFLNSATSKY